MENFGGISKKKYPVYLYHRETDEPILVDNESDEEALVRKGWQRGYIHKEYPKWVDGFIVKNKAEHDARLSYLGAREKMKVGKGNTVVTVTKGDGGKE